MCLTETLDEMVSNGTLSPELAIQVLVQFDKVEMPRAPLFFLVSDCGEIWSLIVLPLCVVRLVHDGCSGEPSEEQGYCQGMV